VASVVAQRCTFVRSFASQSFFIRGVAQVYHATGRSCTPASELLLAMLPIIVTLIATALAVAATPYQGLLSLPKKLGHNRFFDIQVRKTSPCYVLLLTYAMTLLLRPIAAVGLIPSKVPFQLSRGTWYTRARARLINALLRGLIEGSTTLELDNGITKVPQNVLQLPLSSCPRRTVWWLFGMI
jgi:hypothetical protein